MEVTILEEMLGKVFSAVTENGDEMRFVSADATFVFYHLQDYCESVYIYDVCGDLNDLVGEPLLEAEEVSDASAPDGYDPSSYDSQTWTFYKFGTRKGSVTVRWLGESNGYYSERVDFEVVRKP